MLIAALRLYDRKGLKTLPFPFPNHNNNRQPPPHRTCLTRPPDRLPRSTGRNARSQSAP